MVRRSLIVAALLAVSSPLAAQEEQYVWSLDRPDAEAPLGVVGARTLEAGHMDVGYRFSQINSKGVWFAKDSLQLATALQLYPVIPLELSQQTHTAYWAFGVTNQLTVLATAEFSVFERTQLTNTGILYITRIEDLGDLTAEGLYEVYRAGPFRVNGSFGVVIPTGKARVYATTPFSGTGKEALPYDQRPGGGVFGLVPGATVEVQNEKASVGAQFKARLNVGNGAADFTPGDVYEANGWGAYKLNDVMSLSAGIRWASWGRIEGADPQLDPTRDPGNDPVTGRAGGQEVDMPIGVNVLMPSGSVLAGHRFQVEAVYALHHDYEGVRLGTDWGINLGWTWDLGLGF